MGVRDERAECPGCGESIDACACPSGDVCPGCGEMPMGGGCGCGGLREACGVTEEDRPCEACGMFEVEGTCGCTHLEEDDVAEVAPPGKEKMVKTFKKDPDIDNPWALAWSIHNKEKED